MIFDRTEKLLGAEALEKLRRSRVAVFGMGGVGGILSEALVRSGVGEIAIIDKDTVDETNINRQIIATGKTVGMDKVEAMKERLLSINPLLKVTAIKEFYLPDNADFIDLGVYDYVADAIDNVTAKVELVVRCRACGVPVICAMGAGNKLHPEQVRVADISKTRVCPLARIVRRELKSRGIESGVKAAYSEEVPTNVTGGRVPASMMPVPAVMGLIMASEIIADLIRG